MISNCMNIIDEVLTKQTSEHIVIRRSNLKEIKDLITQLYGSLLEYKEITDRLNECLNERMCKKER